jgi:hypothetical protein
MWLKQLEHLGGDLAHSIAHGVVSTLSNLYHGAQQVEHSIDLVHLKKWSQDWRDQWHFFNESRMAVLNLFTHGHQGPLYTMIYEIIRAHADAQAKINKHNQGEKHQAALLADGDKITHASGYLYGKYFVSKRIIRRITQTVAHQVLVRFGTVVARDASQFKCPYVGLVVSAVSIEGVVEKSIQARDRLRAQYPKLYLRLKAQHIEMLYFLVEKPMIKYVISE